MNINGKSIIIEISPIGEVQIEAVGFKGEACTKATEAIEKALGVPTSRKKKPEYHMRGTTAAQQRVGGA